MIAATLRKRRMRRWLFSAGWAALVLFVGTAVSIHLILRPERFREWIDAAIKPTLHGTLDFGSEVEIDPWRLGMAVRDARLLGADGEEIFRADRAAVYVRPLMLISGRIEPREVVFDRPSARIVRRPDGSWNFVEALRDCVAGPGPGAGFACPIVRLRDGRVSLRMEPPPAAAGSTAVRAGSFELEVGEIAVNARDLGGTIGFDGELRHPLVQRLRVSGTLDVRTGAIDGDVRATKVDLSVPFDRLLEGTAAADIRALGLQGFADIDVGRFHFDPGSGFVPVAISGRLIRSLVAPPGLPFPLKGIGGKFLIAGRSVELKGLDGWFGAGKLAIGGLPGNPGGARIILEPTGEGRIENLRVSGEAIPLDGRLRGLFDPKTADIFDRIGPQGTVAIDLRVASSTLPPRLEDIEVSLVANGLEFAPRDLPFRFREMVGEAFLSRGRLELRRPFTARNRDVILTVTGRADARILAGVLPGGAGSGGPERSRATPAPPAGAPDLGEAGGDLYFEAKIDNLAFDEELRGAIESLSEDGRRLWDEFKPGGCAQVTVNIERKSASAPIRPGVFIAPKGGRICFVRFPYPIDGITGVASFDFDKRLVSLSKFEGKHAGKPISLDGAVEYFRGGKLRLDFHSESMTVDDDLKAALPPHARALLEELSFQGRGLTDVKVFSLDGGGTGVEVRLKIIEGEASIDFFPYPVRLLSGEVEAAGERALRFSSVEMEELVPDGSRARPARILFNGGIASTDDRTLIDFHFDIRDLAVNDNLRKALPPELCRFVKNMGLDGTFQGKLDGTFDHPSGHPEKGKLLYHAREVEAKDAKVNFGIKMQKLVAAGEFLGGRDEEGRHVFRGNVKVKSSFFNRIRLNDADIDFAFGMEHPAIAAGRAPGVGGGSGEGDPGVAYKPGKDLLDRLTPGRVADCFQMLVKESQLYGGTVRGFLAVDMGQEGDLMGNFKAEGVKVAAAAPDVFGKSDQGTSGEARGHVSFKGRTGDVNSIVGAGQGIIEKARLVELPLFMGLLSLIYGEFSTENYFNDVSIDFKIRDGKFRAGAEEIQIRSSGLQLRGGGTMDFDGKLNIALSPQFIRLRIPIIHQVLGVLKKGLAQIWVIGDIAHPDVRFATMIGIIQVPIDTAPKKADRPLPSDAGPK